jgi:transposase
MLSRPNVYLNAFQAVEAYQDLGEIERSFLESKISFEMRPIYHWRPKRVRPHIFVATLAFLPARVL